MAKFLMTRKMLEDYLERLNQDEKEHQRVIQTMRNGPDRDLLLIQLGSIQAKQGIFRNAEFWVTE